MNNGVQAATGHTPWTLIRNGTVVKTNISKPTVCFRVLVPAGTRIQLTKLGIWTHKTILVIAVSQHLVSLKSCKNLGSILVYIHDILHTRNEEWVDLWAEQDVPTSPAACQQARKPRKVWEDWQKMWISWCIWQLYIHYSGRGGSNTRVHILALPRLQPSPSLTSTRALVVVRCGLGPLTANGAPLDW